MTASRAPSGGTATRPTGEAFEFMPRFAGDDCLPRVAG